MAGAYDRVSALQSVEAARNRYRLAALELAKAEDLPISVQLAAAEAAGDAFDSPGPLPELDAFLPEPVVPWSAR